jgi:hypothetical protein
MILRPSHIALGLTGTLGILFGAGMLTATLGTSVETRAMARNQELVRQLGLSDLALFTEARYTRHPSMADLHTAFQDHPVSFDHFPSGSLVPPTRHFVEKGGFSGEGL